MQEPGVLSALDIPQRENICCAFCTCLQTLCVWLQDREEVTRLGLWASQGLWSSPVHRCSDLPQRGRHLPAGRRGAAKLKSRALFPSHPPLIGNIDVCRICRQPTFPFSISRPFCATSPPRRPCSVVEEVLEGSQEFWVAVLAQPLTHHVPLSSSSPRFGASVSSLAKGTGKADALHGLCPLCQPV